MARRRYRRRRNGLGSVVTDTAHIGAKLSPIGALVFGSVLFIVFYWLIPGWLETKAATLEGNMFAPAIEALSGRRVHLFQWVGIACGLVGLYFAVRNHSFQSRQRIKSVGYLHS